MIELFTQIFFKSLLFVVFFYAIYNLVIERSRGKETFLLLLCILFVIFLLSILISIILILGFIKVCKIIILILVITIGLTVIIKTFNKFK